MAKIATNRTPSFIKNVENPDIDFPNDICALNIKAITNKYFEVFIIIILILLYTTKITKNQVTKAKNRPKEVILR